MMPRYDLWKLASPPEIIECGECGEVLDKDGYCRGCGREPTERFERDPDEAYDRARERRFED